MEKTQKSFDFQKSQLPEQSYLEAVFPDMKSEQDESDEMSAKIPMATLGWFQTTLPMNGICHGILRPSSGEKLINSDKMEKRMSLKEKFWTGSGEEHSQFPLDGARSKPGFIRRRILFPL